MSWLSTQQKLSCRARFFFAPLAPPPRAGLSLLAPATAQDIHSSLHTDNMRVATRRFTALSTRPQVYFPPFSFGPLAQCSFIPFSFVVS